MIEVKLLDIQASMHEKKPVIVGTGLVAEYNIGTVRPIVSMTQEDGTNDQYVIPGSLMTFLSGTERVMYVAESVAEIKKLMTEAYVENFATRETGLTESD